MVTALDNQLHNVTCPHMPRMLFVYLEMTAVRYGPSKPYVMLDLNVLVIYLKQFQMIATTEPGMINPTLALDSCYRTDIHLACACHRYIDVRPTPRHMDRGIVTMQTTVPDAQHFQRMYCTGMVWYLVQHFRRMLYCTGMVWYLAQHFQRMLYCTVMVWYLAKKYD